MKTNKKQRNGREMKMRLRREEKKEEKEGECEGWRDKTKYIKGEELGHLGV